MKEIKLTHGYVALVDDDDYVHLSKFQWVCMSCKSNLKYAHARIDKKYVLMHRFMLNLGKGEMADHKNGNGLDNRRGNLRTCTHAENMRNSGIPANNTSGYKGVYYCNGTPRRKPWRADIYKDDRKYSLGYFETSIEAARAYNEAALKYHGDFARLNEI